jgi:cytochrome c oxidase subunit 2
MTIESLIAQLALATNGGSGRSFWMPPQSSTVAGDVDRIFYWIFYISLFFFTLIVVLMVLFAIRFRRKGTQPVAHADAPVHNTPLELTWTILPTLIVFVIFYVGFRGFLGLAVTPANAYEVQVTGQRWKWQFTYPNGYVAEDLHVPGDRPVSLVMTSEDVIHSFYVPDFRIKRDVVPGRYAKAWFQAREAGNHQVFCAEYCGTNHSMMLAQVIVHEPGGFEKWLDEEANALAKLPPAEAGAQLYKQRGCAQCHSIDGKAGIGPTFLGVFGHQQPLKSGETVLIDEDYVRESILEPQAKVAAGFDPVMPTYKGRLKDQEITVIIAYLKSLSAGK